MKFHGRVDYLLFGIWAYGLGAGMGSNFYETHTARSCEQEAFWH